MFVKFKASACLSGVIFGLILSFAAAFAGCTIGGEHSVDISFAITPDEDSQSGGGSTGSGGGFSALPSDIGSLQVTSYIQGKESSRHTETINGQGIGTSGRFNLTIKEVPLGRSIIVVEMIAEKDGKYYGYYSRTRVDIVPGVNNVDIVMYRGTVVLCDDNVYSKKYTAESSTTGRIRTGGLSPNKGTKPLDIGRMFVVPKGEGIPAFRLKELPVQFAEGEYTPKGYIVAEQSNNLGIPSDDYKADAYTAPADGYYTNSNHNPVSVYLCSLWSVSVTTVKLSDTAAARKKNGTAQLTAVVEPSEAVQSVSWTSSNPSVASVDTNGLVTAKNIGKCTITARPTADESKSAECVFYVMEDKTFTVGNISFTMKPVESGAIRGSGNNGVFIANRNVKLSGFYMSETEVTQELYAAVMTGNSYNINFNPSFFDNKNHYDGLEHGLAYG